MAPIDILILFFIIPVHEEEEGFSSCKIQKVFASIFWWFIDPHFLVGLEKEAIFIALFYRIESNVPVTFSVVP
jgi:hypothetical protein